jgi:hypothetical protein
VRVAAPSWTSAISRRTSTSRGLRFPAWRTSHRPQQGRDAATDVALATGDFPDGPRQPGVGGALEHVADCSGVDRLLRERRIVLHGQHDDLGVRDLLAQPADRVQAGCVRHAQIDGQHVGTMPMHVADRGGDLGRVGDHVDPFLALEQQSQVAPRQAVVVAERGADRGC